MNTIRYPAVETFFILYAADGDVIAQGSVQPSQTMNNASAVSMETYVSKVVWEAKLRTLNIDPEA